MSASSSFSMTILRNALPRAGPSTLRSLPAPFAQKRFASTEVASSTPTPTPTPYPFATSIHIPPSPESFATITPPQNLLHPKSGAHLINHINTISRNIYDPNSTLTNLFSRRHPERVKTGSIITVISYTSSSKTTISPFSGILMGIRRRGIDSSFTLRNVINKIGVETQFKIYSPMIKEIKIIKRAEKLKGPKGLGAVKDLKRAKVNYLRDKLGLMERIAGALKSDQTKLGKGSVPRRR